MTINNNNNNNNNNNINSKNQQGVVDGDANSNLAAVSIDIGGCHWTMAAVNVSDVSHVTDEDVLGDVVAASDSKKPSREPALRIDSDVIHRTYSDSGLTADALCSEGTSGTAAKEGRVLGGGISAHPAEQAAEQHDDEVVEQQMKHLSVNAADMEVIKASVESLSNEQRILRLTIQAQAHSSMARNMMRIWRKCCDHAAICHSHWSERYGPYPTSDPEPQDDPIHLMNHNEKRSIVTIAKMYGWKLGAKLPNGSDSSESDDEQIDRRFEDALECLQFVTVPNLAYGEAAYNNFVR